MGELKLEPELLVHREKKVDPVAAREHELFQRGQLKEFQPEVQQARVGQQVALTSQDFHTASLNQLVVQQSVPDLKKKRIKGIKDFLLSSKLKLKDRTIEDLGDEEIEKLENILTGLVQDESFKLGQVTPKQEQVLQQSSLFDEVAIEEFKSTLKARYDYEEEKRGADPRLQVFDALRNIRRSIVESVKNIDYKTGVHESLAKDAKRLDLIQEQLDQAKEKFLRLQEQGRKLEDQGQIEQAQLCYNSAQELFKNTSVAVDTISKLYTVERRLDKDRYWSDAFLKNKESEIEYYQDEKSIIGWVIGANKSYNKYTEIARNDISHVTERNNEVQRERKQALETREKYLQALLSNPDIITSGLSAESTLAQDLKRGLTIEARGFIDQVRFSEDIKAIQDLSDEVEMRGRVTIAALETGRNVCVIAGATIATGGAAAAYGLVAGLGAGIAAGTAIGATSNTAGAIADVALGNKTVEDAANDAYIKTMGDLKTSAVTAVSTVSGAKIATSIGKTSGLVRLAASGSKGAKVASTALVGSASGAINAEISYGISTTIEYSAALKEFDQIAKEKNLTGADRDAEYQKFMQERGLTFEQVVKHGMVNGLAGAVSGTVGSFGNAAKAETTSRLARWGLNSLEATADAFIGTQAAHANAAIDGRTATLEEIVGEIGNAVGGTAIGEVSNTLMSKEVNKQNNPGAVTAALGMSAAVDTIKKTITSGSADSTRVQSAVPPNAEGSIAVTAGRHHAESVSSTQATTDANVRLDPSVNTTEVQAQQLDTVQQKDLRTIFNHEAEKNSKYFLDPQREQAVQQAARENAYQVTVKAEELMSQNQGLQRDQALSEGCSQVHAQSLPELMDRVLKVAGRNDDAVMRVFESDARMALRIYQAEEGISLVQAYKRAQSLKRTVLENGKLANEAESIILETINSKSREHLAETYANEFHHESRSRLRSIADSEEGHLGRSITEDAKARMKAHAEESDEALARHKKEIADESAELLKRKAKSDFEDAWNTSAKKGIRRAFARLKAGYNQNLDSDSGDLSGGGMSPEEEMAPYVFSQYVSALIGVGIKGLITEGKTEDQDVDKAIKRVEADLFTGKMYLRYYMQDFETGKLILQREEEIVDEETKKDKKSAFLEALGIGTEEQRNQMVLDLSVAGCAKLNSANNVYSIILMDNSD